QSSNERYWQSQWSPSLITAHQAAASAAAAGRLNIKLPATTASAKVMRAIFTHSVADDVTNTEPPCQRPAFGSHSQTQLPSFSMSALPRKLTFAGAKAMSAKDQ